MPFSRYQIRNEFSLADPELYKSADKDDPEALLEGVAMAGLVGVLRQLGDLAEFAAEIFHGLHEEVMATAARGHGLLTRVQQVESDLPIIERAFLSQTSHSAFFSSSGINWHPNLQTEQNLITKGDLPRFVMDSYEECRGPPRLFLLDKFDVAGAGACLKRYTDPSFYKVEVSSYEMMNAETQRDQKIRKTKKKGPRWKNGDTPDVFQPSHVKLHQLLLEERVQNNTSEPARRVKIKKRETKFPFDTETGKGYMEKILNSPPEDKLVHEVKMVNSPLHLPTHGSEELEPEILDVKTVNSFLDDIEEKHISVVEENKEDGIEDVYQSDDVASETDNYVDALATMESEVETDVEKTRESKSSDFVIRQESFSDSNLEKIQESKSSDIIIKQESFSDSNLEKIQESKFSDSQSVSDDESNAIENKITSFSYSDSDSIITSPNDKSPRGINPPHAFASTEIPFRPQVLPAQVADNCNEVSDNADLLVDQETIFKESDSKDLLVDVNIPTKKEEIEIDPEDVVPSVINEDNNSHSTLVNLHVEDDDAIESKCNSAEITELKDEETLSVDSESQNENVAASERDDNKDGDNKSFILEDISESKDSIHDPVLDNSETNETKMDIVHNSDESVEKESFEESVISPELDFVPSGYCDSNGNANSIDKVSTELIESDEEEESGLESVLSPESNSILDNNICGGNENDVDNLEKESVERDERKESSVESDSIPTVYNDHKNIQILDNIHTKADENDVDNPKRELNESNEKNESIEESVISPESDSIPSAYDDQLGTEFLDIFQNNGNGTDIESSVEKKESNEESDSIPSASYDHSKVQHETVFVAEKTGQNGLPDAESAEPQESKSSSVDQNSQTNKLKADQVVDLLLPKLSPVNMEEMPPLPPLPPMQWITGRFQNPLLTSMPGGGQADISHIPSVFPETETQPFPNQNEISRNEKHEDDYEVDKVKFEDGIINEKESHGSISEPEIIRLASTSSLPSGDNEMPNGIRPMKIQRPRTPLIDAVAAHDKNKLRKVTERATPLFPKDEEKDTFLQQIRAKSFNLKPAVPTRPIIQGPTTNLRVAAILEKANAIRQAFAGSDDDEDDNDSWSDS